MKGISIHIGLNGVDPQRYDTWEGKLKGAVLDAERMEKMAKKQGFSSSLYINESAKAQNIKNAIRSAATNLAPGDFFLVTCSAHGGRLPDRNREEADAVHETWCLYDAELVDNELFQLWSEFDKGVRILVVSDTCYAGTILEYAKLFTKHRRPDSDKEERIARLMPPWIARSVYLANEAFYNELLERLPPTRNIRVEASVKSFSACADNEKAYETRRGGNFTNAVLEVWNDGAFSGNYQSFFRKVSRKFSRQTPQYIVKGLPLSTFDRSKPFTI